ncbi:acyltransferase [Nocardioides sp. NPDC006273]|uniref:acyltransferase family protein n=1 Tax=Nocardioides sp. NPDC006273 TaxID=3155598 RepID=UPI0033AE8F9E
MSAPKSPTEPSLGRMAVLDAVRLFAAIVVVLYHFTARAHDPWQEGTVSSEFFPDLSDFTVFGQFGVDLFFIISGFVILMSAWGRDVTSFTTSRISRLFPGYWAAVLLTAGLLMFVWAPTDKQVELTEVGVNLTMVQTAFSVPMVDGVYWTLWFELRFYVLIGILMLFGLTGTRVLAFAAIWPTAAVLAEAAGAGLLSDLLIAEYAPMFAGGMAIYMVARDKRNLLAWLVLLQNVALGAGWASLNTRERLMEWTAFEPPVIWCVLASLACFVLVALVTLTPVSRITGSWLTTAGLLTYPLYLIHQYWGFAIIRLLQDDLPRYAVLAIAVGASIVLAWLIHRLVERPLSPLLKRGLKRSFESLAHQDGRPRTKRIPAPALTRADSPVREREPVS